MVGWGGLDGQAAVDRLQSKAEEEEDGVGGGDGERGSEGNPWLPSTKPAPALPSGPGASPRCRETTPAPPRLASQLNRLQSASLINTHTVGYQRRHTPLSHHCPSDRILRTKEDEACKSFDFHFPAYKGNRNWQVRASAAQRSSARLALITLFSA
jgi:hypothetical protein